MGKGRFVGIKFYRECGIFPRSREKVNNGWVHRKTEITTNDRNYLSMTEITDMGAEITLICRV